MLFSFPPMARSDARVLILGSMPGVASLQAAAYYAHPRNAFWPILGQLLGFSATTKYSTRQVALAVAGIAVWDVLRQCRRQGSLDADIEADSTVHNDFAAFFAAHPGIRHVFFNGSVAESLFRPIKKTLPANHGLCFTRLPSTSPAHAARGLAEKMVAWQAVAAALKASTR